MTAEQLAEKELLNRLRACVPPGSLGRLYPAEAEKPRAAFGAEWDEAIAEADTLLLTVPNQLGVDYNAHVVEAILKYVAPGLGWR